ncbi:MAG: HlyD family type I secretion periplasmic adaptor subunit [Pelagibacteraceae bacterium]|nr:HlyD family type I secretion periplasmic adaptor subunit [Pelagibacteraceae bacterium]
MFKFINGIFFLVLTFIVIAFFWLKFTMVDEIIRADGAIEPEGKVQTIQPRFQSIIEEIKVSVGDKVKKGDLLAKLNDEESQAQLEENLSNLQALDAQIVRLKAEVIFAEKIIWPKTIDEELKLSQQKLFILKRQTLLQQMQVINEEAKLIKNKIEMSKQQIKGFIKLKKLKQEEKEIYLPLVKSGSEPRVRLVNINQELQQLENEILNFQSKIKEAEIEFSKNEQQKKEMLLSFKTASLDDLANKENEVQIIRTKTNVLKERVSANKLLSPVNGFVTKVMPSGPGAVIKSGDPVIEIVPVSSKVMIKANLLPQNINNIKLGQPAKINLLSYDFTTYGSLRGAISSIAQNTTTSENGDVFYNIWIECTTTTLSKSKIEPEIIPGMLVQVEITGEERSILDYLLQPFRTSVSKAFTEKS